jgi:hypothetical protein
MILRNYDNIMTMLSRPAIGLNYVGTDNTVFGDGHLNAKSYNNGAIINPYCEGLVTPFKKFSEAEVNVYTGSSNLICGAGDTPVTYDDYKLDVAFTTDQVKVLSKFHKELEPIYNESDNSWTFTYTKTFTAKEDIVVKEIGVTSGFYYNSSNQNGALIFRKVLDTPIEVPANANFTLSFTITKSANPNKPANYEATASVE